MREEKLAAAHKIRVQIQSRMLPECAVTPLVHNTQRFQIDTGVLKLEIISTITRNLLKSSKIYSRVTYGKRCKEDDSRGTEVQTKNCHPKT